MSLSRWLLIYEEEERYMDSNLGSMAAVKPQK